MWAPTYIFAGKLSLVPSPPIASYLFTPNNIYIHQLLSVKDPNILN